MRGAAFVQLARRRVDGKLRAARGDGICQRVQVAVRRHDAPVLDNGDAPDARAEDDKVVRKVRVGVGKNVVGESVVGESGTGLTVAGDTVDTTGSTALRG